ncbi:hypothetical protein WJX74_008371 [Apatococcus lobatus]|uniref:N-acetyltransferase domain-containing protein n=1 Tax=Apatococcus lobatus TaxID=904363 RepID=A0AAW1QCN4_9CHLO
MKANENLQLTGRKVVLVPYCSEHVQQYHSWMSDPALLEATASEPLSLEEEYEMQKRWRVDPDKCTFIILDRDSEVYAGSRDTVTGLPMIGDVNLFMHDLDHPESAEVEIMVAEKAARRQGRAQEAVEMMLCWAHRDVGLRLVTAKIGDENYASLQMFRRLGFSIRGRSLVFKEITLVRDLTCGEYTDLLQATAAKLEIGQYIKGASPDRII